MKLTRFTTAAYGGGLLLGLGLVFAYGAVEVSSTPTFCGSCHVMKPYYASWEGSSHEAVACVECHIAPGVAAEFRKKMEGLSMVVSYFTGTYGTNPWAEVEDAACLECHERRLLAGAEVFGDVIFDHRPHLTEMRRGKRLRCTSCHSQIVQGSHIAVTQTTCILCHIKDQPAGTGTARCTLCHRTPNRVVDAGGLAFDHGDVEKFGMRCESCHEPAPARSGAVPRERCLTCHNEQERLAAFDRGDYLHRTHVTDHKVECTHCHLEIEHVPPRHLDAARSGCEACHGGGHSPQRDLYAGIGGKGVTPMPDVMFLSGVRCEGCHLDHGDGRASHAGEVSCMSCHGPAYRALYQSWSEAVSVRTAAARRELDATARLLGSRSSADLDDARANLDLVERGHGIHNVPFSLALLDTTHGQLNKARRAHGFGAVDKPWPAPPYDSPCLECHAGAEFQRFRPFGRAFSHQPHVIDSGISCETCHSSHEARDAGAGRALLLESAAECNTCHHRETTATCASCHVRDLERTYAVELGDFTHQVHVEDFELACADCHGAGGESADRDACSACH